MTWIELIKQLGDYTTTLLNQPIYVYDKEGNEIEIHSLELALHDGEDNPQITEPYFLTLNEQP